MKVKREYKKQHSHCSPCTTDCVLFWLTIRNTGGIE